MSALPYGRVETPMKGAVFPGGEMQVLFVDHRPLGVDLGDAYWARTGDDSVGFSEQHISHVSRAMTDVGVIHPTREPSSHFNSIAFTDDGRAWKGGGIVKRGSFREASFSWGPSVWRWTVEAKEGLSLHYIFSSDAGASWQDHWVELDSEGLPIGFGYERRTDAGAVLSCRSSDGQQWFSAEGEQVATTPPVGIDLQWWRVGFRGPGFVNPQEVVAHRADISQGFTSGRHAGFILKLLGGEGNGAWDVWYDLESKQVATVAVFAQGRFLAAVAGAVTEREEEKFPKSYHLAKGEMVIIPEVLSVQALAFSGGTYFAQRDLAGPEKPCYIITYDNQGQPTGEVFYSQLSDGRLLVFRSEDFGGHWQETSPDTFPFRDLRI